MDRKIVLSERLNTLSRTYFFDVKESTKGKPYLVVTESYKQKDAEGFTRNSLLLFDDDAPKFLELLTQVVGEMAGSTSEQVVE